MLQETHPKVVQHLPECQQPTLQGGTASAGMTGTVSTGISGTVWTGIFNGAKRAAMVYSFFATCKLNGIDPLKWLHEVIQRLPDHHVNKLEQLLPLQKNWPGLDAV